jgi:hypothetical protein
MRAGHPPMYHCPNCDALYQIVRTRRKPAFGRSLAVTATLHFRHAKESSLSNISCCERPRIDKGGAYTKPVAAMLLPHDFCQLPINIDRLARNARSNVSRVMA